MSRPRSYKTEAVVLKQMPLGEADRILTLFSRDLGKLRTVAKGVRRANSRLTGHLELLMRVHVSLAQGRDLDVVTEAETIQSFRGLREDLHRLSMALYLAELVDSFSQEQSANEELYQLLLDALGWLAEGEQPDHLLAYFELRLLEYSGFRPELHWCVECRAELKPGDHFFACGRGGVLCPDCRTRSTDAMLPAPLNAMKVLRFLQREDYAKASSLKVPAQVVEDMERLLRSYIRYLLERDLKSADFMDRVASGRPRAATPL